MSIDKAMGAADSLPIATTAICNAIDSAKRSPLTGRYSSEVGLDYGWLGWIEGDPDKKNDGRPSWIAFIRLDGFGLLWTQVSAAGTCMGTPLPPREARPRRQRAQHLRATDARREHRQGEA